MTEFLLPFIIFALIFVIIVQAVERYFYNDQVNRERAKYIAAILSKDVQEYNQVLKTEQTPKKEREVQNDIEDFSEADQEVFDRAIERMNAQ